MCDDERNIDVHKDCKTKISKEYKKLEILREFEEENKLPPNANSDLKTIDMIKYYNQARKDHNFELIEVMNILFYWIECYRYYVALMHVAEYSKEQGVRQPVHTEHRS